MDDLPVERIFGIWTAPHDHVWKLDFHFPFRQQNVVDERCKLTGIDSSNVIVERGVVRAPILDLRLAGLKHESLLVKEVGGVSIDLGLACIKERCGSLVDGIHRLHDIDLGDFWRIVVWWKLPEQGRVSACFSVGHGLDA